MKKKYGFEQERAKRNSTQKFMLKKFDKGKAFGGAVDRDNR